MQAAPPAGSGDDASARAWPAVLEGPSSRPSAEAQAQALAPVRAEAAIGQPQASASSRAWRPRTLLGDWRGAPTTAVGGPPQRPFRAAGKPLAAIGAPGGGEAARKTRKKKKKTPKISAPGLGRVQAKATSAPGLAPLGTQQRTPPT